MPCTAASPKPLPVNFVVKKGSKICALVVSSMPQPVSRTLRHTETPPPRRMAHAGADLHRARLVADSFRGVDHQVHHQLLHLAGVGLHQRQVGRQIHFQLHLARDGGSHQLADLADHFGQMHGLHHELALACVRQQLPGELGGALAGPDHVLQHAPLRLRRRKHLQHQAGVAQNSGKQIIEVVRHAAGEQSQAFQLLRLPQLLFQILALRAGPRFLSVPGAPRAPGRPSLSFRM